MIDPSVYQDPTIYRSGGFANPAEFADSLDQWIDGIENSIGFDPIIGYSAIPIYNEGLRIFRQYLNSSYRYAIRVRWSELRRRRKRDIRQFGERHIVRFV